MKLTKRSNRKLPSPLELAFYLFAVIAFCVINWTLLKVVTPPTRAPKSIESLLLEAMLEKLPPVTLPADKMQTMNAGNFAASSEQALKLEPWMLDVEAFFRFDTESEIVLEDWMINTATWSAPQVPETK
jgi:hypothetical protein